MWSQLICEPQFFQSDSFHLFLFFKTRFPQADSPKRCVWNRFPRLFLEIPVSQVQPSVDLKPIMKNLMDRLASFVSEHPEQVRSITGERYMHSSFLLHANKKSRSHLLA